VVGWLGGCVVGWLSGWVVISWMVNRLSGYVVEYFSYGNIFKMLSVTSTSALQHFRGSFCLLHG
jgi:hypothetical protein